MINNIYFKQKDSIDWAYRQTTKELPLMEQIVEEAFGTNAPEYEVYFDKEFECPRCFRRVTPQIIQLSTVSNLYQQVPYQFFHELCHLMIGVGTPEQLLWFEESICALASIYFMLSYEVQSGLSMTDYVQKDCSKIERFETRDLFDPNSPISKHLSCNEYDRQKNRWIALKLFNVVGEYGCNFWRFVTTLSECPSGLTFTEVIENMANHYQAKYEFEENNELISKKIKAAIINALND